MFSITGSKIRDQSPGQGPARNTGQFKASGGSLINFSFHRK